MHSSLFLLCCGLAISCALALTVQQATITGHNDIRRKEAKDEHGSNIYELVWDSHLAHEASAWAAKCDFSHQHIRGEGENIYYASPDSHTDDYYINRALTSWMGEKHFNKGDFNCCYHGHYDCCHYTQVVAARTRKVGCAVHKCAALTRSGHTISHNAAFVVCDYGPMGNLAVNGHHETYADGTPCSACDTGDKCHDGLCLTSA